MKYVVIPYSGHTFEQMFYKWSPFYQEKICERSSYMLKRSFEEINIELCSFTKDNMVQSDVIIHYDKFSYKALKMFPLKYHFYIATEPAIVCPAHSNLNLKRIANFVYDTVITTHEVGNSVGVYQVHYPFSFPNQIVAKKNVDFAEKRLACMFAGNKYAFGKSEQYSVRRNIIHYFEKFAADDFDLYGYGWDGPYQKFKVYCGPVDDKLEVSSHYKFAFCLENERFVKANITEKIFDAMIAGTVPIYEGIDDIEDYVPANCFIKYSDFDSLEALVKYLKSMTEEEYMQYRNNIEQYILSDKTRDMFSAKNMRDQIVRAYQEQTSPKKHRALWLLALYAVEQKIYNILCRLQKYFLILKMIIG